VRAYDYVVIDLASTLSEDVIPILDLSELVCLVLSPDVGSVAQGRQSVTYLQSHHFSRDAMKLVLNRYSNKMPFPPRPSRRTWAFPSRSTSRSTRS
jgi:Flp pilus assembly CpaE family ATPase